MRKFDVRFGDIWNIGKHRLFCGDSTEKSLLDAFLQNEDPKLCVTDPPYGVDYTSYAHTGIYDIKVAEDDVSDWSHVFSSLKVPVLYTWFSFKYTVTTIRALKRAGYVPKQLIVWDKKRTAINGNTQCEFLLYSIRAGLPHNKLWLGDKKQRSLWRVDGVSSKRRVHPTEKPSGVYTIPILNHSKEGDRVLDLFAGSGVLFEACELTRRVGLGVEILPSMCETILNRFASMGLPVHLEKNIFETGGIQR